MSEAYTVGASECACGVLRYILVADSIRRGRGPFSPRCC